MVSFSTLKYGSDAATLMASEWCRRRQHFFNVWLERKEPDLLTFTEEEIASYEPPPEWSEWFSSLSDHHVCMGRARAIQLYKPGQAV